MATKSSNSQKLLPTDRLRSEVQNLAGAVGDRAIKSVRDKVGGVTDRLTGYAENNGGSSLVGAITGVQDIAEGKSPAGALLGAGTAGLKDKLKKAFGGKGKGKGKKITSIIESIDVGVPVKVAYNQWTQFSDFPGFMKKVESVEQQSDEKLRWKAQIFWSHRSWESTIKSQVPDDHIVWRSKGDKGYVDGAVTFHELAPNLTRVLLVLEYHPQGLFEHTGNLWRAQGRRARLELKQFRRHVMTDVITHPDDIEGWRGVIEDDEVVQDHEPANGEEPEDHEESGGRSNGEEPEDHEEDGRTSSRGRSRASSESRGRGTGTRSRGTKTRDRETETNGSGSETNGSGTGTRSRGTRRSSSREPAQSRRRTTSRRSES